MRSSTGGAPTVNIASTGGGSAMAGVDYMPLSATVSFKNGCAYAGIPLQLMDDDGSSEVTPPETVQLTLGNPSNGYTLGTASTTVTIVEDTSPPAATVQASVIGTTVTLSWAAGTDSEGRVVDEYTVWRSMSSGSGYTQVSNAIPSAFNHTLMFTDGPLAPGNYYYIVKAVDDGGTPVVSNEVAATIM